MDRLLKLIENNPRLTNAEIAVMLGETESAIDEAIRLYEESGVIKGYRAIFDESKANPKAVTALIELKVQPKFGHGFNDVAERICALDEVESVYLMSGGTDLCCIVKDKSFEEVAMFVVKRLSPLEDVVSTKTNFILKRYKEQGVDLTDKNTDDRRAISL